MITPATSIPAMGSSNAYPFILPSSPTNTAAETAASLYEGIYILENMYEIQVCMHICTQICAYLYETNVCIYISMCIH
jgi:hypothetical protein